MGGGQRPWRRRRRRRLDMMMSEGSPLLFTTHHTPRALVWYLRDDFICYVFPAISHLPANRNTPRNGALALSISPFRSSFLRIIG